MFSITTDKQSYASGETISATISYNLGKPTKARAIVAKLVCIEQKQVKTTVVLDKYEFDRDREMGNPYASHMETKTEVRESTFFSQEKKLAGDGTYSSGEIAFSFTLPKNAPPTSHEFGHDSLIHIWKLRVKLDIPFAIDVNGDVEIFVEGL